MIMLPKLNYKKTELSFIIKMRVFTIYIYKLLMNLFRFVKESCNLSKYRINIHYVRKRTKKRISEQLVNRFQSLSVPPNQTVWKNVSCDLTREKKKKQMSLSSVYFSSVCVRSLF